jgi:hypothetical protein
MNRLVFAAAIVAGCLSAQVKTLTQGPHRMEITVERRQGGAWRAVDPGLVFAHDDRVRFRFRTNFDGFLYVMNQNTSGKYEQLFPREDTGRENRIGAGKEYLVPATQTAFRITGPPGHEIVYWMMMPAALSSPEDRPAYVPLPPPPPRQARPPMQPRCDDALLRTRGDCIDSSAGPKLMARGDALPENLAQLPRQDQDLLIMREKEKSVVSSPVPLTGPVIYEFRLAHK